MAASDTPPFLGKFRGTVVNNIDPKRIGRIQAIVPDVSRLVPTSWAMPCVPVGGPLMGFFAVPPVGSGVWIEFERGDPDYPIWTGCYWGGAAEVPALAKLTPPLIASITLQTPLGHGLSVSDLPGPTGGIVLQSPTGAKIIVNDTGISLETPTGAKIQLVGNMVMINDTALTIQ
jgi:uncharacterized protein involved in type VI secretion and phage assembly